MISDLKNKLNDNDKFYYYKWLFSAVKKYGIEGVIPPCSDKLRLVLGLGRSGTTWVGKTLSKTKTPLRFLGEPLFHFLPPLKFSNDNDHTSIDYHAPNSMFERLERAYKLFCSEKIVYSEHFNSRILIRNDESFEHVLVKEVHCLLQTEHLIDRLGCPTILICRHPLRVADSLFSAQSLNTIYLKNEFAYILNFDFHQKYFKGESKQLMQCAQKINSLKETREKKILEKVFTIWIINRMFKEIAQNKNCVRTIDYEVLCNEPDNSFSKISDFLNFQYTVGDFDFSKPSMIESNSFNPYSVNRYTKREVERDYNFLVPNDISFINNFFESNSLKL